MSDTRSTAEEQAASFFAALDPVQARLEQITRMSPTELLMLARARA